MIEILLLLLSTLFQDSAMTFIVIQMENPLDLENISVLPDENDLKVKQFRNEEEAVKFLVKYGMIDELDHDAQIVRLH